MISSISKAAGSVSISTVALNVPAGMPSCCCANRKTSFHSRASRGHHHDGRLVAETIALAAGRIGEVDFPRPAVAEVELTLDHIGIDGGSGVLEIGHEHFGAGVQRIDDHFAVDRAGD